MKQEDQDQFLSTEFLSAVKLKQELEMSGTTVSAPAATSSLASTSTSTEEAKKGKVVLWVDGCFDFMHFGHANAIRQAKVLFPNSYLICGVHSDEEIFRFKGPSVMNAEERYAAVRACRWVDECVEDVPYVTSLSQLHEHKVNFCVHGDDLTFDEHGRDSYWEIKQAGLMQIVKRTEGVSTTDLVQRMLKLAKMMDLKLKEGEGEGEAGQEKSQDWDSVIEKHETIAKTVKQNIPATPEDVLSPKTKVKQFLPTVSKISQFSASLKEPKPTDRIVYVDGGFDLFHVGHMDFLRKAREQGDYLIVGLYDDKTINEHKGYNFPIMNLHERVLSILSCRYVDDVIIGAPYVVTENLIQSMKISLVVTGSVVDPAYDTDPYQLPAKLGILKQIESPRPNITTTSIVKRILEKTMEFEKRNKAKLEKEAKLNEQK